MSRKVLAPRSNAVLAIGVGAAVALVIGCGSNSDTGVSGVGGGSVIVVNQSGGAGAGVGGRAATSTGGRNFGRATGGTPVLGAGGSPPGVGGTSAANVCLQGSKGCPCYVLGLCTNPTVLTCNADNICCAGNDCAGTAESG